MPGEGEQKRRLNEAGLQCIPPDIRSCLLGGEREHKWVSPLGAPKCSRRGRGSQQIRRARQQGGLLVQRFTVWMAFTARSGADCRAGLTEELVNRVGWKTACKRYHKYYRVGSNRSPSGLIGLDGESLTPLHQLAPSPLSKSRVRNIQMERFPWLNHQTTLCRHVLACDARRRRQVMQRRRGGWSGWKLRWMSSCSGKATPHTK